MHTVHQTCGPMKLTRRPVNLSISTELINAAVAHIALSKNKPGRKAKNLSDLTERLLTSHLLGKGVRLSESLLTK